MSMIERFQGDRGRQLLIAEFERQALVERDRHLAEQIADRCELVEARSGEAFITQGASTNDVFLIVAGVCDVVVNGRVIAVRGAGTHVGEMAAIQPAQPRAATVIARDEMVLAKVAEPTFTALAETNPSIYRAIARELAVRLKDRNRGIGDFREKVRVFVISSAEAIGVAREIETAFEYDDTHIELWTNGVFRASNYTIESLENEIDIADFAIAVAHADDVIDSRGGSWPVTRDNVIFELGLFMGRLGKSRAILMEPRGEHVQLPSDLAGLTTISYQYKHGREATSLMAPACNRLRKIFEELGPSNG